MDHGKGPHNDEDFLILADRVQDGLFVIHANRIIYSNEQLSAMTGYNTHEIKETDFMTFVYPEDQEMVRERHIRRMAGHPEPSDYEFRIITKTGEIKRVSMNVGFLGDRQRLIGTLRDVTVISSAVQEMEKLKKELEQIIRKLPDIYYRTDLQGRLIRLSPSVTDILGYKISEVIGTPITNYYVESSERDRIVKEIFQAAGEVVRVEAPLRHKNGTPVWFSTNAYLVYDDAGSPSGIEGLARDDTKRKSLENELKILSEMDYLTGIYNRRVLFEKAEFLFAEAAAQKKPFAISIIDLDDFKNLNDTFGHMEGDKALEIFGEFCRSSIRPKDSAGRIGGEEFMLLFPDTDLRTAVSLTESLLKKCTDLDYVRFSLKRPLFFSAGVAVADNLYESFNMLRFQADQALYRAKKTGRNRVMHS